MKFKIVKYNARGKAIKVGDGEIDGEELSWSTKDKELNRRLKEINEDGSVPTKHLSKRAGVLGEVVRDISISDDRFLSVLSDWLMGWDFIED